MYVYNDKEDKEKRMTQLSKQQIQMAIDELAQKIPSAPSGVNFTGIRIEDGEDEDISVRVDFPRWSRHPDEYGGDNNAELNKRINVIERWEDKVWVAIEEIKAKYKIRIGMRK